MNVHKSNYFSECCCQSLAVPDEILIAMRQCKGKENIYC